ncbi:hypothetical protein N7548_02920 [Acholeplasma manati]|uniref:DUF304 domain-containing protein n=1 Tax=Paracholeplasma manati TaxID=591373 RepID=A0ABT2Y4V1_9MOLU|nr:hypothetical protein [Paracholeplasma manati]MCV2231772.1 hypothetical protein [Paracholeplasma manati]
MKKSFITDKYGLQMFILNIILVIYIACNTIYFYYQGDSDRTLLMGLSLVLLSVPLVILLLFYPLSLSTVDIDHNNITVKSYGKLVLNLEWSEIHTITDIKKGHAKYLIFTGQNNQTIKITYSVNVINHIMSVCKNQHVLDQINKL